MGHDWPGNVRELENFIERALIQSKGHQVDIEQLMHSISLSRSRIDQENDLENHPFPTLDAVCTNHIRRALGRSKGKISGPGGAAELLGLHPNTLRQRMDKLGVEYKRQSRKGSKCTQHELS
jgi:DNA-binding NtrC family response regulator